MLTTSTSRIRKIIHPKGESESRAATILRRSSSFPSVHSPLARPDLELKSERPAQTELNHFFSIARVGESRLKNRMFFFFFLFLISVDCCRNQSVRRGKVRPVRAVRDQPTRDRELRVRPGMRAGDEAGMRARRQNVHVVVRAEETGLFDEDQHRGRLHGDLWLQGALLREGQSSLSASRCQIGGT